jgi:hypothetical protein
LNPRQEWLTHDPKSGNLFCSLVDGFEGADPVISSGHVVEIPGFGRITLGQLLITPDSVRLVAIRADLGCPVSGGVTVSCVGGGGGHDD